MQVNITGYLLNGVNVPFNGPPCTGTCSSDPSMCIKFGAPCLQIVNAEEEGVTFTYGFNSTAGISPVSVNAYICYSTWSQIGRPWRATSAAKGILVRSPHPCGRTSLAAARAAPLAPARRRARGSLHTHAVRADARRACRRPTRAATRPCP